MAAPGTGPEGESQDKIHDRHSSLEGAAAESHSQRDAAPRTEDTQPSSGRPGPPLIPGVREAPLILNPGSWGRGSQFLLLLCGVEIEPSRAPTLFLLLNRYVAQAELEFAVLPPRLPRRWEQWAWLGRGLLNKPARQICKAEDVWEETIVGGF